MIKIHEIALKIVFIGDEEVGKTSLVLRYTENRFTEAYKPTLGADFAIKEINYNGENVKMYLWDIAGSGKYENLHKFYFEGTNVFLLVYDLTNPITLENAEYFWLNDIIINCASVPIILIGNKKDLNEQRRVFPEQISQEILDSTVMSIETSAKTGHNIENLFLSILNLLEIDEDGQ